VWGADGVANKISETAAPEAGRGQAGTRHAEMSTNFVRFVLTTRHHESGVREGHFRTAYRLRDSSRVDQDDRRVLTELLGWFGKNLATPEQFNRSKSKGFYRRATRGIAWFKDSAADCLSRIHRMRGIWRNTIIRSRC